jgi:surfactin synthase thioesterase subunit
MLTMEQQAQKVFDLAHKTAKEEMIFVIAHSMGGPIALQFVQKWLSTDVAQRAFTVTGCAYAEGNISPSDCFSSGKIARQSFEDFKRSFDASIVTLNGKLQNESAERVLAAEAGEPNEVHVGGSRRVDWCERRIPFSWRRAAP